MLFSKYLGKTFFFGFFFFVLNLMLVLYILSFSGKELWGLNAQELEKFILDELEQEGIELEALFSTSYSFREYNQ